MYLIRSFPRVAFAAALALSSLSAASLAGQSPDAMRSAAGSNASGRAATRFGGHVGSVVPAIRHGNGVTSDVSDRFIVGFPVGLTVKPTGPIAIDFEFIPTFNTGSDFVLTIHPGVIYGFAHHFAAGVRAAYDAGSTNKSYGITPLLNRRFAVSDKLGWFTELAFPIRRNQPGLGQNFTSVAIAGHLGLSF